jgi:predicted 3-demethylubiquinone-9 3-methyltransferase (glyoxalase superfamily)
MPSKPRISTITPCLWFDNQAEQAANLYTSVFPNSRIDAVSRYGETTGAALGLDPGSVLAVSFALDGQSFTALNAGPVYRFNEAVSFQVQCDTQDEIDHYWDCLGAGGDESARQCGWLKDRFGLSWQVVPRLLSAWTTEDPVRAERVIVALLPMKKLDLAALRRAYES